MSAALLLAVLRPACATAATTEPVVVEHNGAGFTVTFNALIDAPPRRVYEVLTDYSSLPALNPAIVAVSAQAAPDSRGERVRIVLKSCIWLFCRKIVQVEDVVESDAQTILTRIVSGRGNFKSGWSSWHLTAKGARTHLHYEASRVPDFWIPPLIGPWAVAQSMREQLEASIPVLERLANQPPGAAPLSGRP
ncbi:MAG TPA: SRPBCC family protein [Burkholderiales bacterium]|nr:SRPBCC family protein [Burkholderiales bacterium]